MESVWEEKKGERNEWAVKCLYMEELGWEVLGSTQEQKGTEMTGLKRLRKG